MDLELKEFEEKINNITEQFMSLLNSNDDVNGLVENKINETPIKFDTGINGPTIFNSSSDGYNSVSSEITGTNVGSSAFRLESDTVNFGGIGYGASNSSYSSVPKHAVKFESSEIDALNKKLEELYSDRSVVGTSSTRPNLAFSDSNMSKGTAGYSVGDNYSGISTSYVPRGYTTYTESDYNKNSVSNTTADYNRYTNEKTNSTLNKKEVYEMANYNGGSDVFSSFATIPADRALVEKRSWKDTLFMDIPWDTKIDIWGGIKTFCTTKVKITF